MQHDDHEYGEHIDKNGKHSGGPFRIDVCPQMRIEEVRLIIRVRLCRDGLDPVLELVSNLSIPRAGPRWHIARSTKAFIRWEKLRGLSAEVRTVRQALPGFSVSHDSGMPRTTACCRSYGVGYWSQRFDWPIKIRRF
jgi:hypothetical protein